MLVLDRSLTFENEDELLGIHQPLMRLGDQVIRTHIAARRCASLITDD